jgi:probable HAF family extracellular repeat protein
VGWVPDAATAISRNGLIAGEGQAASSNGSWPPVNEHAFVLSGGSMAVIPSLGIGVYPHSINASGEVAGLFFDNNGYEHAFIYTAASGIRDIGNLGGPLAVASTVTDSGLVLGGSELSDGSTDAFLYTDTAGMIDLNTLFAYTRLGTFDDFPCEYLRPYRNGCSYASQAQA